MSAEANAYLTIFLMAAVTYGTRIAGAELMTLIRITPRIEAFLKSMAVSVMVAIVASAVAQSGFRENTATLVAAAVMAVTRSSIAAVTAGMVVAAAWNWLV
ncbi:AzlD family protein [Pelagibius sp. Alg239-R121]|uniref:AzlD family protein n=1 Tax=Pelagibius sp. Alg239-R121 TaxID=2993448 RepID=UPI0024A6AF92|nr:AzlD domain-containing protein [Pelagibius sp. Alg239-R121]